MNAAFTNITDHHRGFVFWPATLPVPRRAWKPRQLTPLRETTMPRITWKLDDPDSICTTYYECIVSYKWEPGYRATMHDPGMTPHPEDVEIVDVQRIVAENVRAVTMGDRAALIKRLNEYVNRTQQYPGGLYDDMVTACIEHERGAEEEFRERKLA